MRTNSSKQSEASRRNGARSKGPKSSSGKQKVKRNAIREALYTKDVIVEQAGESLDEFKRFRDELFQVFQPVPIAEIFFNDFVENWWRRQRVRRAETITLEWESASLRAELEKINDVERLGFRFTDLILKTIAGEKLEPSVREELEECRIKLSSSSLGVRRLQEEFRDVQAEVERTGKLTRSSLIILGACFGLTSGYTATCTTLSGLEGTETEKVDGDPATGARTVESEIQRPSGSHENTPRPKTLIKVIQWGAYLLERRGILLGKIESREAEVRKAEARVAADAGSDRYSRAETMHERRMHRAFMLYVAAQRFALPGAKIPQLPTLAST